MKIIGIFTEQELDNFNNLEFLTTNPEYAAVDCITMKRKGVTKYKLVAYTPQEIWDMNKGKSFMDMVDEIKPDPEFLKILAKEGGI